jgi:uncharacterized protein
MSSSNILASFPLDEAGVGAPTLWRRVKAGRLSAVRSGEAKALLAALEREDYAAACDLARPLADRGLAGAQLVLGALYSGGYGVPQNIAEAARWRLRAADQGRAEAQNILGVMYAKGRGVARNALLAAKWFRRAADQNHPGAQMNLGLLYAMGHGVEQSDCEALKWFRKAAGQGSAEALTLLTAIYFTGRGVAQNYVLAHMWCNLAAARGDCEALANRDQLAKMMTPAQVAEAQRLAEAWKPEA